MKIRAKADIGRSSSRRRLREQLFNEGNDRLQVPARVHQAHISVSIDHHKRRQRTHLVGRVTATHIARDGVRDRMLCRAPRSPRARAHAAMKPATSRRLVVWAQIGMILGRALTRRHKRAIPGTPSRRVHILCTRGCRRSAGACSPTRTRLPSSSLSARRDCRSTQRAAIQAARRSREGNASQRTSCSPISYPSSQANEARVLR